MTRAFGGLLVAVWAFSAAAAPPQKSPGDQRSMSAPTRLWEVSFPGEISMEEYARQLDFFKIEIGAVSKSGKVEYIAKVSERRPEKHVGMLKADYRFNIPWTSGTLHAIDRKLLRKAGIGSTRKELRHFFPIETQTLMKQVEREYAGRDPRAIRSTRFEIQPLESGGYEFVVVEQDPPRPDEADESTSPDTSSDN